MSSLCHLVVCLALCMASTGHLGSLPLPSAPLYQHSMSWPPGVVSSALQSFVPSQPSALCRSLVPHCPSFYFCSRILGYPCSVSAVSSSIHPGISEAHEADPTLSALLWVSTPNFKAACSLKGGGLCRKGFCISKWKCVNACTSWHTLRCFLPAHSLLLCLATANSAATGLVALSAVSPQGSEHSWGRLWSLPWDKPPGYVLCE